uniref:Uncharacterized protein n=1 Tax=Fagus sylvatica TaxID=28930 RepID=A0A2N9GJP1_FAGSY
MADSQLDSNGLLHCRANPGLDICFQGLHQRFRRLACTSIEGDAYTQAVSFSLEIALKLKGQQANFCEAYEVKVAHSNSSMYGKLPLSYSSDSLSQASRSKDGNFGSHGKVGDEARIGAITGPVDFTVTSPSQVHTGP